jgi:enoyl-CoA hydratase
MVEGSWSSVIPTTCHDESTMRMPEPGSGPSEYETLRVERRGPVGWLVFDRPAAANAMDARMMDELEQAWRALDRDPEVRVIVNTGAGDAFQTGLDMAQLARDPEELREQSRRTKRFELRFTGWHNDVWKPVIAAVNGVCAGGGLHFVADADIAIASSDASFVDPHVSVGQASVYETIALAKKSPMESVLRMAFVGRHERLSAQRAYELGICSQVVDPPERLWSVAQALGELIARNSPAALEHTKRVLWGALERVAR